jgi:hypothetical protein
MDKKRQAKNNTYSIQRTRKAIQNFRNVFGCLTDWEG